jgi:hypothetical protein
VQRIWADRGAAIQDDKNQDDAVKPRPVNPHDHLLSKPVCVVETQQRAILIVLLLSVAAAAAAVSIEKKKTAREIPQESAKSPRLGLCDTRRQSFKRRSPRVYAAFS